MKKLLILIGASIALSLLINSAFADAKRPCKPLMIACKAAGFKRGGEAQGKGMWKNCMEPILTGQTVPGVNVNMSAADMQACKTNATAMMQKHM